MGGDEKQEADPDTESDPDPGELLFFGSGWK